MAACALHGGFRTRLTGVLDDEAQALPLLSLPGVAGELALGAAPRRLQHKLMAALPADAATLAGRLQQRLHVDPLDWYHESLPVPHLPALARAALDNRRVRVVYDSWSGPAQLGPSTPLGLVLKAGSWYAVVRQATRDADAEGGVAARPAAAGRAVRAPRALRSVRLVAAVHRPASSASCDRSRRGCAPPPKVAAGWPRAAPMRRGPWRRPSPNPEATGHG